MILNDKQLAVQEAILKRLYPNLTLEEAKKKELWFWCIVKHSDWEYWKQISKVKFVRKDRDGNRVTTEDILSNDIEIIGLPPTLPRILTALGKDFWYNYWVIDNMYDGSFRPKRKLLNEDMTDCNLRQQSQETQDAIYNILCDDSEIYDKEKTDVSNLYEITSVKELELELWSYIAEHRESIGYDADKYTISEAIKRLPNDHILWFCIELINRWRISKKWCIEAVNRWNHELDEVYASCQEDDILRIQEEMTSIVL